MVTRPRERATFGMGPGDATSGSFSCLITSQIDTAPKRPKRAEESDKRCIWRQRAQVHRAQYKKGSAAVQKSGRWAGKALYCRA